MEFIIENIEAIGAIFAGTAFVFAAIARLTPNKSDNKIADILIKIVNALGLNIKGLKEGLDEDTANNNK